MGRSLRKSTHVVLSIESGSLREAANRRACSKQRRIKAATNALERKSCECPDLKLHPRKVAQSVVIVGPPRRCTMLREVVAIGRSRFLTEAYAAETEGIPTAPSPTPRRKIAHASTATLNPRPASQMNGSVPARARNAPPADTLRIPNRRVSAPIHGQEQIIPTPRGANSQPVALGERPHARIR